MRTRSGVAFSAIICLVMSLSGVAASADTSSRPPSGTHMWQQGRSHPVEDPYYPAKSNPEIDALHYNLALSWDGSTLTGDVTIDFRATIDTSRIRLDLIHSLRVSAVTLDGRAIAFKQPGNGLVLDTGALERNSQHDAQITYAGKPHTVKAPSHRGDEQDGLGWSLDQDGNVFTFQEPFGAYTWYPVNDHPSDKAMYDAQVTVAKGQTAVFNGVLQGRHPNADKTTTFDWHLDYPVASYLTTIAIGPYREYKDTLAGGTPATYWLLPRDEDDLTRLKSQTEDAFAWLLQHAGPYPFNTFGTVVVGGSSAMETETMVTMSRTALDRPDAVVEHEMAHQWYGDAISPVNWLGMWLNEGWAMWMQQAYETYRGGYKYLGGMKHWRSFDQQSRRQSGPPGHYDRLRFGELDVYLGPAMMLDRIRRQIGNAAFTKLSEDWVSDHEYGNVDRHEFIVWVNQQTGMSFTKLIDRWLDSPHTPGGG